MPETHILSKDKYLYSYIDINSLDADRDNPPTQLAIGKTIAMARSDSPTIVKSDDKLKVHGIELNDSQKKTLAKLFYFTGKTLIYKPGWVTGSGYCFIGVNSEGDSILSVPKARGTPMEITTFELPLKFDWSNYGVVVPGSALAEKQSELDQLKEQLKEKENRVKELEQRPSNLNQQLRRIDQDVEKNDAKIKELEQKLEKKDQEIKEKDTRINGLESRQSRNDQEMEEKDEKIKELTEEQSKLKEQLKEKDQQLEHKIEELEQQLHVKNQELQNKDTKIKELVEQQSQLQKQLEEKDNEIKVFETQPSRGKQHIIPDQEIIEKKDSEIKELKEQQSNLTQEIEKKNAKINELEQQLSNLNNHQGPQTEFQLVSNKLDQLLATLQTSHVPQVSKQPLLAPEVVESRRCHLLPDKFSMSVDHLPHLSKRPQFRILMKNLQVFTAIDENVDGQYPKGKICLYTSDRRFHNNEWWFIKAGERSNTTMVGFYDGDFDQVSVHGNYVSIPFRPEATFNSNTQFFVGLIRGIGLRFMFTY